MGNPKIPDFNPHRCWWRMLETKCFGDNLKMTVTDSAILVTNILYFLTLASGTNIQKMSPNINFVANILKLSPTVSHQHQNVTNMTVAAILWACLFLKNFLLIHFCRSIEKISLKSGTCLSRWAHEKYETYAIVFSSSMVWPWQLFFSDIINETRLCCKP